MRARFPWLAARFLIPAVLLASGCGRVCTPEVMMTDAGSSGSLQMSSSSTLADIRLDGGDVGLPYENVSSFGLSIYLRQPTATNDPACIEILAEGGLSEPPVSVALDITMTCPPSAGNFSLQDLRATACDESKTCAALNGTAEVQEYTPLCSDYSCGSIILTLDLPAVAGGVGPFVYGIASTWVAYGGETEDCSSSNGGITD